MYYLGIDIGASSVKLAAVSAAGEFLQTWRRVHQGSPLPCLCGMLDDLAADGFALEDCAAFVSTGSGAEMLEPLLPGVAVLEDVPALVRGVQALAPGAASIIQMGAQSALYVTGFAGGKVPEFSMNESCAAGTGSFFEDQMARLGLRLEDYSTLVSKAETVPRLSGRCSVFAKTDIIHRQQEGVPVEDILQGLCHATVKAFKATIVRNLPVQAPIALTGGTLLNAGVVRAVREVFKLGEGELLCAPELTDAQAVGAALQAASDSLYDVSDGAGCSAGAVAKGAKGCSGPSAPSLLELREALGGMHANVADDLLRLPALPSVDCSFNQGFALAPTPWNAQGTPATEGGFVPQSAAVVGVPAGEPIPVALGVDVGSTSTNLVLLSTDGVLLDAQYLRTRGNPKQAVCDGLASLKERVGGAVRVVAAGVTGSGRSLIGEMIGADAVRDEITAQARAAAAADPLVDTVFEIGGQDSKYISLAGSQVADFQMNKVCAAGTGSFVEEQAGRLGIDLPDYGPLALSAQVPVDLGERCTVFVETAINAALAKGASKADVAAGLCLSVVRNYLHKVVGTKPVGTHIVLQGGVAYNPAIVAAFKAYAGDNLTVSPWFAVSGAVGAALLALAYQQEQYADAAASCGSQSCGETEGLRTEVRDASAFPTILTTAETLADSSATCEFESNFRGWDLDGASSASQKVDAEEIAANRAFFNKVDEYYLEGYDPTRDPAKKTVGIPRALMIHKLFPMANAFFSELGFNVLLTDASSEDTVQLAQASAQGETCYPVKLMHGHMAQLVQAGVDYVFMPSMHTIRHVKSKAMHNYACTYMQSMPAIVAKELDFEGHGITLLNPQLNLDFGQGAIAEAMLGVGAQLGKTPQETARAMLKGGFAVSEFTRKTEDLGDELLNSLKPGERVICIVTRNYGIVDPALNMGIPNLLLDRGQKVITISHLHAHDLDISADYPGVVWPFGEHILSAVKMIARDPRMFAVYLTNHGCGPDTMLSHLVAEEMGSKPFLQIEMDEHYSKVGVETRVEAFLNAINQYKAVDERSVPTSVRVVNSACESVRADEVAGLPSFGPYGPLVAAWLRGRGLNVEELHPTSASLDLGRKETTSKEYYSFASLLGLSMQAAQAGRVQQLLLPSSQGGEADSLFDRVVRSVLDERGFGDVRVIAPDFELLPCNVEDPDGFFVRMLAGDVILAAAPSEREALLARLAQPELSLDDVLAVAREVGEAAGAGVVGDMCVANGMDAEAANAVGGTRTASGNDSTPKQLAVVGEWPYVAGDELVGGLWQQLESEGYDLKRAPFAEYLWFLWNDGCEEGAREKVIGGAIPMLGETASSCGTCGDCAGCSEEVAPELRNDPLFGKTQNVLPQDEWHALLDKYASWIGQVSQALGAASAYSSDLSAMRAAAKDALGMVASGNARYRYAKASQMGDVVRGTLMVASTYENSDIMLRLKGVPSKAPLLHLSFDGALDQSIEDRLRSFLYYL